jgi:hypothetical protein
MFYLKKRFKVNFDSSMRGLALEFYGWSDKFDGFYSEVLNLIQCIYILNIKKKSATSF